MRAFAVVPIVPPDFHAKGTCALEELMVQAHASIDCLIIALSKGHFLIHTAIWVLFWHPLMAFIVPLFAAESLFTSSSETTDSLPNRLQRRLQTSSGAIHLVIALALFCGFTQALNSPNSAMSLLPVGVGVGFLFLLGGLWQRQKSRSGYTLRELLPSSRQALILALLLLGGYLVTAFSLRSEALPDSIGPHLTVWAIYAVLFLLLHLQRRRYVSGDFPPIPSLLRSNPKKTGLIFGVVFAVVSALAVIIKPMAVVVVLVSWVVGCGMGAILLLRAVVDVFRAKEG